MAVVIRLRRTGTRNRPAYRVVVADKRKPRDGRFIENLGHYEPLRNPAVLQIDGERAVYWLQQGAKPSGTVASLLKQKGISRDGVVEKPQPEPEEAVAAGAELEDPEQPTEERVVTDSPIG